MNKSNIVVFVMITLFSQNIYAGWVEEQETIVVFEEESEQPINKQRLKDAGKGTEFVTEYKDFVSFNTLTLDTRFNTPIIMRILVHPLNNNEIVIRDPRGHSDVFDIEQKGHALIISPRKILDYSLEIDIHTNGFREIISFGDNLIQVSGLLNHVFMVVLNDTSYIKITDSIVRKLHIQANDDSQLNGLEMENQYVNIFATDRALLWIDADLADLKMTKGAIVKCERFPLDHKIRTQKTNTFIRKRFDNFDETYFGKHIETIKTVKI